MSTVLLSRTLDPILGVFTGVFAYYLFENHPRTAPPPESHLSELIKWKLAKRNEAAELRESKEEAVDWQALVKEAGKK